MSGKPGQDPQDPEGMPAALLDGEPVDPAALYDGRALGALLRG